MDSISPAQVKELRERTGIGIMECKRALEAASGNLDLAIENLRKSSSLKAEKKALRTTADGIIRVAGSDKSVYMLELNSETDFVAKEQSFVDFAEKVLQTAIAKNTCKLEEVMSEDLEKARQELIQKIGENINVRRLTRLEGEAVYSYTHNDKIGVLVCLDQKLDAIGKDVALHIAAAAPLYISPEQVEEAYLAKEKEIYFAQAQDSGKPPAVIEKMVEGRLRKHLADICLLDQQFVKNPDWKVRKVLKPDNVEVKVTSFIRYQVGEGIEKETIDFAEEVKTQAGL